MLSEKGILCFTVYVKQKFKGITKTLRCLLFTTNLWPLHTNYSFVCKPVSPYFSNPSYVKFTGMFRFFFYIDGVVGKYCILWEKNVSWWKWSLSVCEQLISLRTLPGAMLIELVNDFWVNDIWLIFLWMWDCTLLWTETYEVPLIPDNVVLNRLLSLNTVTTVF